MTGICATRTLKKKGAFAKLAFTGLFSGTIHIVDITWPAGKVSSADILVTIDHLQHSKDVISAYCSAYGPNSVKVDPNVYSFTAPKNTYSDADLQSWVNQLFAQNNWPVNDAIQVFNPPGLGIENTDAPISQGVLGYHGHASGGVYSFVNLIRTGLDLADTGGSYALALSHEVGEFVVDPNADLSNPEISDPCSGNCGVTWLNYFDAQGKWLSYNGFLPPSGYVFFTAGFATPATVGDCPAPMGSCSYSPPAGGGTMGTQPLSATVSAQASSGEVVTITVTKPDGTKATLTATTDANGVAPTAYTDVPGSYSAVAHVSADAVYDAADSAPFAFTLTLTARTVTLGA